MGALVKNTFFGLHGRFVEVPPPGSSVLGTWMWVPHAAVRIWNTYASWLDVNPSAGLYDFSRLDRLMDRITTRGALACVTLGRTPTWASKRPSEMSKGYAGAAAPPRDIATWQDYVTKVVTRYKGRVDAYEIWNEPAYADFEAVLNADGTSKQYFTGTSVEMVQLTQAAQAIVRAIDPAAKVVCPSVTCEANGLGRLGKFLASGGGTYCDVIGYHLYQAYPEEASSELASLASLMTSYGVPNLPVWITEMGYVLDYNNTLAIDDVPARTSWANPLSPHNAGIFLARAILVQTTAGVTRNYWYTWDHNIAPDRMGISPGGVGLNDMGLAYCRVNSWLAGATRKTFQRGVSSLWTVNYSRGNQNFSVLWRESGNELVGVPTGTIAETLYGAPTQIVATTITVGQEPVLIYVPA